MRKYIFSDFDANNIIEKHFVAKMPISDIARQLGVTEKVIARVIVQSGRVPLNHNLWIYGVFTLKCAIALYNYGIGARGIAKRLNVPLAKLISEFKRQGIKLRNQSEQETKKWEIMDKAKRAKQVEACHKATKGVPQKHTTLCNIAKARGKRTSRYETIIADYFTKGGLAFEPQFPVDKYNIDFVVGNIAVEIFGGYWHLYGSHAERFTDRTKKIFDSGYALVILVVQDSNTFTDKVCSDFVGFVDKLSLDKSSIGKYWVIWSATNTITSGGINDINIALIPPFTNIRDGVTGRYKRVAR